MTWRRATRALGALALGVLLFAPLGAASPHHDHGHRYAEDPTHADPGTSPSFAFFPTPEEVQAGLDAHADHPWVTLHTLGTSSEGRAIRMAEVTDPNGTVPYAERVVTFIFTQQHGNEPAGTPAALALLDAIAAGDPIADTLTDQILLLLPMANPDGSDANQRRTAENVDMNRDHIALETPEANAVHKVLNEWTVHVAMDHHEYGGQGLGNPSPVRVYDYDLTTLFPRHGNVQPATLEAAQDLMYEGIWPRAEADGYSANEYGERTVAGQPLDQLAGGPDPGIMRNHLGLHHIAGLLVETRVDAHPNPFHDATRREAIHTSVMHATLDYVHEHRERFIDARNTSLTEEVAKPQTRYEEGSRTGTIPDAYLVPEANGTMELFARHGLPTTLITTEDDMVLHDLRHAHRGHAAAILHPASSRAVAEAAATEAPDMTTEAPPAPAEESPAVGTVVLLALIGAALVAARRPRT